ncbi:hypothetical protein BV898_15893 [Hypsibius exemplaris]|uniref:Uncharacterized protein n=1 Tax=Hypsibius exemplaris TaxID=2072580 RepID=A0A9X6RL04_HYPEX|nr:hypothetical protein BV898_15893 [Hypsibius exemplaris]
MPFFDDDEYVSGEDDIPANDDEILNEPDAPAEEIEEDFDEWSDGDDFFDDCDIFYSINEDPFRSKNGKNQLGAQRVGHGEDTRGE